jgi:hypothetical protein
MYGHAMTRIGDGDRPTNTPASLEDIARGRELRERRERNGATRNGHRRPPSPPPSPPDPDAAVNLQANLDIGAVLDTADVDPDRKQHDAGVPEPVGAGGDAAELIDAPPDTPPKGYDPVRERIARHHRRDVSAHPSRPPGTADHPPVTRRPRARRTSQGSSGSRSGRIVHARVWAGTALAVCLTVVVALSLGRSASHSTRPPRPAHALDRPSTGLLPVSATAERQLKSRTAAELAQAAKLALQSTRTVSHAADRARSRLERFQREKRERAHSRALAAHAQRMSQSPRSSAAGSGSQPTSGSSVGSSAVVAPVVVQSSTAGTAAASTGGSSSSSSSANSKLPAGPTGIGSAGNNCNPKCH